MGNNAYPPGYIPPQVAKDEPNPEQTNPEQTTPEQTNPEQTNSDKTNSDKSGPPEPTDGSKRGLDARKPRALKSAARLLPSDHNKVKRQARKQQLVKRQTKSKRPKGGKKIQKNRKNYSNDNNNKNDYKGMGDYGDDDDDYDYDYDYGSSHSDESDVKMLTPHEYVMFKKRAIESAFQKKTQQTTGPSTPGAPIGQPPNQNQRKGSLNSSAILTPNAANILFVMLLVSLLALLTDARSNHSRTTP